VRLKILILAAIFLANLAFAEESDVLKVDGFGTLGLVHSDNDKADFVTTIVQDRGAGYTRSSSAVVDSRLGIQLSYLPTEKFSAVLQVIAEQRDDGVIRPEVEWAYLQYDITPDLKVRLGRTVLPTFLHSQYRKVSYANHWVRPPPEFYVLPVNTSDGISFLFNRHIGEVNYTLQGLFGQRDQDQAGDLTTEARNGFSIANTFEYGPATLRFAYNQANLTSKEVNELFDVYRLFGSQGAAIADKYNFDDKRFRIFTVGGSYVSDSWFVMSEWSNTKVDTFLGESRAWYVSGGYRFGSITPYLTYSQTRSIDNDDDRRLDPGSAPPFLAGLATTLNGVLDVITRPVDQKTITVGARWDFAESAAFKVQYDHINLGNNSSGTLRNVQPDFKLGDTVNLLSLVIDFTF
jgi:predicted porin